MSIRRGRSILHVPSSVQPPYSLVPSPSSGSETKRRNLSKIKELTKKGRRRHGGNVYLRDKTDALARNRRTVTLPGPRSGRWPQTARRVRGKEGKKILKGERKKKNDTGTLGTPGGGILSRVFGSAPSVVVMRGSERR